MKFILYCKHDPVDLGIEDNQDNWDMEKFLENTRRIPGDYQEMPGVLEVSKYNGSRIVKQIS